MPLDVTSLQSDLESLFSNPPATAAACAEAWSSAVEAYASGVVPASTTVSSAAATLTGALTTAFESAEASGPFELAFAAFAVTTAAGMLPSFTGTPPAAALGISTLLAAPQATHAAAAEAFASLIDVWTKTGSAVSVPPGVSLTWT